MKIILDAMGGDNAPEAPVLGAIEANKAFGTQITLVGRGDEILEVLKKHNIENLPEGIEVHHADDVVDENVEKTGTLEYVIAGESASFEFLAPTDFES